MNKIPPHSIVGERKLWRLRYVTGEHYLIGAHSLEEARAIFEDKTGLAPEWTVCLNLPEWPL